MDVFESAAQSIESTSPEQTTNQNEAPQGAQDSQSHLKSADQAIFDLGKADKYTFEGREWTRDSLKALIDKEKSMDKGFTEKMQKLSEERKSFEEKGNFWKNLHWDLPKLLANPSLVQEFIKKYPPEFHPIAAEYLKANQPGSSEDARSTSGPQPDIHLLSRLDRLEKFHNDQEVKRSEQEIESTVQELSKKYPDAGNFKEMALGRAFEAHSAGTALTPETWEQIFKQVDEEVKSLVKTKYGELVKKQTEVNNKARDVGAGGGIPGSAPVKFKRFDDIARHAEQIARGGE